jgi:hypothetical protein
MVSAKTESLLKIRHISMRNGGKSETFSACIHREMQSLARISYHPLEVLGSSGVSVGSASTVHFSELGKWKAWETGVNIVQREV